MSKLALQLIIENKRTKATKLDLGSCILTELPLELTECIWLEELGLVGNKNLIDLSLLASLTSLQHLSFSSTEVSDLSPLSDLTALRILNCSNTQVSDLSPLVNLTNLYQLNCSAKNISDLSPLAKLINLQELDCSYTQVNDLSPLANLTNLQQLSCSFSQISDLSPLTKLINLYQLSFSSTQVSDLSLLVTLISLKVLSFHSTQVNDLSPLAKLTNLQQLYCRSTQVSDLSPLANLTALQYLDCKSTQISDLSPLTKLTALQHLDCTSTQVKDLSVLINLTAIRQLFCSNMPVSDLPSFEKLTALQQLYCFDTQVSDLSPLLPLIKAGVPVKWKRSGIGIFVEGLPLVTPPPEIVKQGNGAILRYFEQIENQHGTVELYEAKMLIVGEGKTGKTTLFEKLKDKKYNPFQNPTDETHGINIAEGLPIQHDLLGDQIFHANLWDFGGQELQYMTHQFFLTPRALYVLLMDARSESPNLPYWFKIISLLGKAAEDSAEKVRLLLVFNKRRGGTGKMPLYQDVLKYYEDQLEVSYIEVDLAVNENNFDRLRALIEEQLVTLPIVKSQLPRQWKPIREALREEAKKRPYITTERLAEICSKHRVTDERDQWQLSDYLHQLGSLLHFQNDETLMDLVILSPQWAVEGVYSFLGDDQIAKACGRFEKEAIFNILKDKNYTRIDAQKVLQLMTKNNFDICYEATPGHYVAAQLLPDQAPAYAWLNRESLQFRYQYPIMPKGLMSRLIVRLSEYIERDDTQEQVVWKKGVVLCIAYNSEECRVRLLEDDAESQDGLRQILVEVLGEPAYRKYALQRVRQEVEELHRRWFRSIRADELVPCCCKMYCQNARQPYLHKLDKLLNLKFNRRKQTAECGESGEDVSIQLMLEGIYEQSEIVGFEQEEEQRQPPKA